LPNALDPDRMSAAERLAEIGEILAAGLIRLCARQREVEARRSGEVPLTSPPTRASMAEPWSKAKKS
jgi:hypothetical protein